MSRKVEILNRGGNCPKRRRPAQELRRYKPDHHCNPTNSDHENHGMGVFRKNIAYLNPFVALGEAGTLGLEPMKSASSPSKSD